MSVKERIISIRLIEMIHRNLEYAEEIGIKREMSNLKKSDKTKDDAEKLLGLVANKRIGMSEKEC